MEVLTPEEIEALKKKHGRIFQINVEEASAIFRRPTRNDLAYASAGAKGDGFKFSEILFKACFLQGDEIIKDDVTYYLSANEQFAELTKTKEAELKEL